MPPSPMVTPRTSGLAIAGFVISFFCGLVGLILSILAYNDCKKSRGIVKGEGLAVAGIAISILSLLLAVLAAVAIPRFMSYMRKTKTIEATVKLDQLERSFKDYYVVHATFPRVTAPLTPAASCCDGPNRKCVTSPADWAHPAWQAIDFRIDAPSYFQYGFRADGNSVEVIAVGDLDCDGKQVTYMLHIHAPNGRFHSTLIEPPPGAD